MQRVLASFIFVLILGCMEPVSAGTGRTTDPLERPSELSRGSEHSVLLDIAQAGERLVAVGERGIVVLSDDTGKTWRQPVTPTSETLTAVTFATPGLGWIVGHGGTVLHTEDGGETWTRQLDGNAAARLELAEAEAKASLAGLEDQAAKKRLAEAQRLVSDGPDKPFLALNFDNEKSGFIVGAYGLIFRTEDGGKSWRSWMGRLENPGGLHLYAVRTAGSTVYLAGEQGLFLRSTDGGNSFTRLQTPYRGSYFGIAVAPTGEIVLAGLRGNAYRSSDQGETFTAVEFPVPVSISSSTTLKDGTLLFANQEGQLFESRDKGCTVRLISTPRMPPLASVQQTRDGALVAAGLGGVIRIPMTDTDSAKKTGATQ